MFTRSFRSTVVVALFAGATVLPSASHAQGTDSTRVQATTVTTAVTTDSTRTAAAPSGARLAPVGFTSRSAASVVNSAPTRSAGENVGQNKAMMAVGAAALVVGLVIGGDIGTLFAVGGAAVGLVGLYKYMQ